MDLVCGRKGGWEENELENLNVFHAPNVKCFVLKAPEGKQLYESIFVTR